MQNDITSKQADQTKKNYTTREKQEIREHDLLSPFAAFSDRSLGRDLEEEPCDIRPAFQRDRDRIVHSKAFRRLKGKTQVFLSPEGDHYRNRLTHTLEVSQIARTIAKTLQLNEDLTEAIALGHDLGHTPFGHAGERALDRICPGGFKHQEQGVRVVELLEKQGQGLNLTKEVRDGIRNHQTASRPMTLEGRVVRLADKIAYINHDIDDAIRAHIIKEDTIPKAFTDVLGHSQARRLNTIIHDIILHSEGTNDIGMSEEVEAAMMGLRKHMFEAVYTNPVAKGQEKKAEKMLEQLFEYYVENFVLLPKKYQILCFEKGEAKERVACDYVAGMTDSYAILKYHEAMVPTTWSVI